MIGSLENSMKILVDADACPKSVLRICRDVGRRHDLPVWTVASFNHNIESDHHILVGDDPQETDIKILNVTEADDVVVSQDWGLAAVALGKGATCLSPTGREFHSDRIDFLLEEREVKAKASASRRKNEGTEEADKGR